MRATTYAEEIDIDVRLVGNLSFKDIWGCLVLLNWNSCQEVVTFCHIEEAIQNWIDIQAQKSSLQV